MPQGIKTFRVFVSSTFTDMRMERSILQKDVFPRLRALCESKGASFQDVDLRWGVNEEAQLDHKIMDICLGEVARCQRLSPKPNFIILLGDKYGWQPVPSRIPSSEMELIKGRLGKEEKHLLGQWYREDLNAVPPEYVLQPREGQYSSYEAWQPVEATLRDILRKGVTELPFTEEQKVKYFASATHQEIVRGALNLPPGAMEPGEHVFAYLRTIRDLPEDAAAKDYIDISDGHRDAYSKTRLEKLKEELKGNGSKKGKLPRKHIHDYGAHWNDGCILDDAKAFGERVYADLKSIIEGQLEEVADIDPIEREKAQHEEFKNQRLEHFTGRTDALNVIAEYLDSSSNKVFSVVGGSGTGKTSLLAKAIEQAGDRKGVKIFRFCGTTTSTSDPFTLLSGLIREITSAYGIERDTLLKEGEDEKKFSTLRGLQDIFLRCLNLASIDQPLLIVLDALDQLSREYKTLSLDWVPKEIPDHVGIIVSALPELREKLAHTAIHDLASMPGDEGATLLERWLFAINRTLMPEQKKLVIDRFSGEGTPLFLKLAFEKARGWYSYSTDLSLEPDIDGVLAGYFDSLEKSHDPLLVRKVCGYLLSGKYQGLMEQEVLGLLIFDTEHRDHFLGRSHPDHRQEVEALGKLPLVIWSRLFLDLEPYLTVRDADGLPLISFYHRKFNEYARTRYFEDPSFYHSVLAQYFEKLPIYLDEKEQRPHTRKIIEQPYQETLSERWVEVADNTLASFPFLMAKAKADMVEGILEDYTFLWDKAPEALRRQINLWRAFFTERAHIIHRGGEEWPAHKVLLQLAVEHADDSPITTAAEKWLSEGKCDWIWLRRIQRVKEAGINPCLAVLEGHTNGVNGAVQLADGRILSWSDDKTLRIWDTDGRPISVLEGHTSVVRGALELADGRILSWSDDKTLRIWDTDGRPISVLEGHTNEVNGAVQLADGRILSWSGDKTLRIWDADGRPISVLEGHTNKVNGAVQLADGRILSWSWDKTRRIWDTDGRPIAVLGVHTGPVDGAIQLADGRILSWSKYDKTLRIWDTEGRHIAVLEGHTDTVFGAVQLADGRILSWSADNALRIWDTDGRPIAVLKGHTDTVNGAVQLADGRILSWSWHNTLLRIWDADGRSISVPEGHTYWVKGAVQLADGRILSWSKDDKTMRIWDTDGRPIAVLEGHTGWVNGAVQFADGRVLSWSQDETLRIWDAYGRPIAVLERHTSYVSGAIQLADGRILSWSADNTLRIWDTDGRPISVLEGHTGWVNGAVQFADGRILSWSWDNTLRIWDTDGRPIAVLEGHTGPVFGAVQLADGRILSRSWDNTLRIWDTDGRPIAALEGHTDYVNGAVQFADGRILSWSWDNTLRIWDSNTGVNIEVLDFDQFCIKYPESVSLYLGKELCYLPLFSRAYMNYADISLTTKNHRIALCARWHAESDSKVRFLRADGILILTQDNGQVCFLELFDGQKHISLEELLALFGISPHTREQQN
jgi:WD40 repeat protein